MNIKKQLDNMILSPSGWRKVFAESGLEEDKTRAIADEDKVISTAMALSLIKTKNLNRIVIGTDARPTGPEIARYMINTFLYFKIDVIYIGIASAPEIMAFSSLENFDCFVYISASHNPIGHNGVKFGKNGGVFPAEEIYPIIDNFKKIVLEDDTVRLKEIIDSKDTLPISMKGKALIDYRNFVLSAVTEDSNEYKFIKSIKEGKKIGIVGELNGSARGISIDKSFLKELGINTLFLNDTPGEVVHGIVPEGENLELCRKTLEEKHKIDPSFILGYVPDNDGDRGNLVYINKNGKSVILKAQEVFALVVYSTLMMYKGKKELAVAVNGPTSYRIEEISNKFKAKTFRAEVGEANVVQLGEQLRRQGYAVPILGEGSNGGNITYPSKVRDPMNTLLCLCRVISDGYELSDLLEALPIYTTTDAFSSAAKLHLKTKNFNSLKEIYEDNFIKEWENKKNILAKYKIEKYKEVQTNGIIERYEKGNGQKGGLKMIFTDVEDNFIAYIWMRPSGTEPLFRISADVKGDNIELHDLLLEWQKAMILNAEKKLLNC